MDQNLLRSALRSIGLGKLMDVQAVECEADLEQRRAAAWQAKEGAQKSHERPRAVLAKRLLTLQAATRTAAAKLLEAQRDELVAWRALTDADAQVAAVDRASRQVLRETAPREIVDVRTALDAKWQRTRHADLSAAVRRCNELAESALTRQEILDELRVLIDLANSLPDTGDGFEFPASLLQRPTMFERVTV